MFTILYSVRSGCDEIGTGMLVHDRLRLSAVSKKIQQQKNTTYAKFTSSRKTNVYVFLQFDLPGQLLSF
jgi:hypothetical protein